MKPTITRSEFEKAVDLPAADKKAVQKEIESLSISKIGELVKLEDIFPYFKGQHIVAVDIAGGEARHEQKDARGNVTGYQRVWCRSRRAAAVSRLKQPGAELRIGDLVYLGRDKNNIYKLTKIQMPWRHDLTQYCVDHMIYANGVKKTSAQHNKTQVILCPEFGNVTKQLRSKKTWDYFDISDSFLYGNIELDHVLSFLVEKKKIMNVKTQHLFDHDGYSYTSGASSTIDLSVTKVDILDMCLKRDEYLRRADKMSAVIQAAAELSKNSGAQ